MRNTPQKRSLQLFLFGVALQRRFFHIQRVDLPHFVFKPDGNDADDYADGKHQYKRHQIHFIAEMQRITRNGEKKVIGKHAEKRKKRRINVAFSEDGGYQNAKHVNNYEIQVADVESIEQKTRAGTNCKRVNGNRRVAQNRFQIYLFFIYCFHNRMYVSLQVLMSIYRFL